MIPFHRNWKFLRVLSRNIWPYFPPRVCSIYASQEIGSLFFIQDSSYGLDRPSHHFVYIISLKKCTFNSWNSHEFIYLRVTIFVVNEYKIIWLSSGIILSIFGKYFPLSKIPSVVIPDLQETHQISFSARMLPALIKGLRFGSCYLLI